MSPEENDPLTTSQASCKPAVKRLREVTIEAALGLMWALLTVFSIAILLGGDAGVTDFRYVGF